MLWTVLPDLVVASSSHMASMVSGVMRSSLMPPMTLRMALHSLR